MKKSSRDLRLDIIRIFAFLSVICVHFFLKSNFYAMNVSGIRMYTMVVVRSFFMVCVPLFIMLTGYLMNKKELNKKFYKGLIRIAVIYLICSVIYHLFDFIYYHNSLTIRGFVRDFLQYRGTAYAWYVELYIGLFLLIPFLNMIFNNLKDKKQVNALILTMFFITGLPAALNSFYCIFPDWWVSIYPLTYYFLGAYLSRYDTKISIKWNIIFLVLVVLLDGSINFIFSYNKTYVFNGFNNYFSGSIMITTFLTFNLLLKIKVKESIRTEKVLKTLSDAVFGAYLLSCMFEAMFYEHLFKSTLYAPLIIFLVFSLSLTISMIINVIYNKVKEKVRKA